VGNLVEREELAAAPKQEKGIFMIELVFVACLTANSGHCEEKSMLFAENLTPMACMMQAQPELAKWVNEHPKWQVSKWSCRSGNTRRASI
jgi:hypothetical protein